MKSIHTTKSVCPVCLRSIVAELIRSDDAVILSKTCTEHGKFETVVWRGEPDFTAWIQARTQTKLNTQDLCPHVCGLCQEHVQRSCTVLFELTQLCNLHCPICFANATNATDIDDGQNNDFLPLDYVLEKLEWIRKQAGSVVLQLSGGEPTLYPHLVQVVQAASKVFPAVQLNTNGLLLAEDVRLAKALKDAGLSWVFLQCDGTDDAIHIKLRGQALLEKKIKAIEHCKQAGLSVVIVSTLARGVNDNNLGDMLQFGLSFFPTVRGLHIQPMTLSGRNSFSDKVASISLPEVLQKLSQQSRGMIKIAHASPSSCEHALCSFHCRYHLGADGNLEYVRGDDCCCEPLSLPFDAPERSIETVIRSWQGDNGLGASINNEKPQKKIATSMNTDARKDVGAKNTMDAFDAFIAKAKATTFSISCMAFQDVHTLDLERLQTCCVHVYDRQDRLIPFCAYNLTSLNNVPLYRR